jgi:hypothetical protein
MMMVAFHISNVKVRFAYTFHLRLMRTMLLYAWTR